MQSLWFLKCNWDDPLPFEYLEQWEEWASRLPSINKIEFPRFVNYIPNRSYGEIHDQPHALQRACGAVIYLRVIDLGFSCCFLLVARTKVALLETLSKSRLEYSVPVYLKN